MNARDSLVEWKRIHIRNEENTTLFNALQNFKEEKIKYNDDCLSTKLNITITLCVKNTSECINFQKGNEKRECCCDDICNFFSKAAKKTYFYFTRWCLRFAFLMCCFFFHCFFQSIKNLSEDSIGSWILNLAQRHLLQVVPYNNVVVAVVVVDLQQCCAFLCEWSIVITIIMVKWNQNSLDEPANVCNYEEIDNSK